jgi:hypothetical protein
MDMDRKQQGNAIPTISDVAQGAGLAIDLLLNAGATEAVPAASA